MEGNTALSQARPGFGEGHREAGTFRSNLGIHAPGVPPTAPSPLLTYYSLIAAHYEPALTTKAQEAI